MKPDPVLTPPVQPKIAIHRLQRTFKCELLLRMMHNKRYQGEQMTQRLPASMERTLKRLQRRVAIGQFFEIWPSWAVISLMAAGLVALICRVFAPSASSSLPWLFFAPLVVAIPA